MIHSLILDSSLQTLTAPDFIARLKKGGFLHTYERQNGTIVIDNLGDFDGLIFQKNDIWTLRLTLDVQETASPWITQPRGLLEDKEPYFDKLNLLFAQLKAALLNP